MRRTKSPRAPRVQRNRVVKANIRTSERSVWLVNDNGQPKSPLSIERLPRYVERNISRIARVKPRCRPMSRKRRAAPENSFPFFIDKSPSDELVGVMHRHDHARMNDSVVILDSPTVTADTSNESPKRPTKEIRRQDSVDTVDLCSDDEEERLGIHKLGKRKKRAEGVPGKRRRLSSKSQDPAQPDIILLDDEDESVSLASGSNASIIIDSTPLKEPSRPQRNDISEPSSSIAGPGVTSNSTKPVVSQESGVNFSFKSKYLDVINSGKDKLFGGKNVKVTVAKDDVLPGNALPGPSSKENSEINSRKPELSNPVGSNVFNPCRSVQQTGLRPVIIDGCNVAIAHGGNRMFSVRGLCICVEYFLRRGHTQVVALVPLHQRSKVSPQDRDVLESLKNDNHLVYTPSRFIDNRLISSYDDRYIVQYAAAVGGVIVSRDNYRDLLSENPAWRDTITNRLLMPTWVGDILMFPVDPLGKSGPSLDDFLKFPAK
ncbi:probable ribonuclease ZC3H12C [Ischnura elegans]|uniref:probable ribonuclease ZC3H12C n=1 Tax=Ischnura elegans TaxID=197161 RepID=UPI001ED8BA19|nr:probable ribonuclease ZC3H12C [Ischnura elegans]XP_046396498.1 probable ribonuclease ZC3H12C [Ischnura elegans]